MLVYCIVSLVSRVEAHGLLPVGGLVHHEVADDALPDHLLGGEDLPDPGQGLRGQVLAQAQVGLVQDRGQQGALVREADLGGEKASAERCATAQLTSKQQRFPTPFWRTATHLKRPEHAMTHFVTLFAGKPAL